MSWVKDTADQLINLDDVRKIQIAEVDESEEGLTHGVFAFSMQDADDDTPSYNLFTGTEELCVQWLDGLMQKLPMLKVK